MTGMGSTRRKPRFSQVRRLRAVLPHKDAHSAVMGRRDFHAVPMSLCKAVLTSAPRRLVRTKLREQR
jgi:hypothetical protein